jgi:predicted peptidase
MNARHAVAVAALAILVTTTMNAAETGFLRRTIRSGELTIPYTVYVPPQWTAGAKWPVILFLHGAGERGTDGEKQTAVGLGRAVRLTPERFPALIVFPQAPEDMRWIGAPADAALAALDETIAAFNGDPRRVYLTGLSLGGYGTWHLALAAPDRFAAIVPVCGGIVPAGSATSVARSPLTEGASDPYAFTAAALRKVPVWIFHGADDPVVLPSESRRMRDALEAAGADVHYTEYEGVGHDSWTRAYGEAALWEWMFAQRR